MQFHGFFFTDFDWIFTDDHECRWIFTDFSILNQIERVEYARLYPYGRGAKDRLPPEWVPASPVFLGCLNFEDAVTQRQWDYCDWQFAISILGPIHCRMIMLYL